MKNLTHRPPQAQISRHARLRRGFDEVFDRSEGDTIAAMDEAGDDLANQQPHHPIPLRRMGMERRAIPVTIADPFDSQHSVQLSCAVSAFTSLDGARRGIHVSRIADAMAQLSLEVFPSLAAYATALGTQVASLEHSAAAAVDVSAVFSYLEPIAGVKDKASIEHLDLFAHARIAGGVMDSSIGLGFNHITACPCVQQTFKHALDEATRLSLQMAGPDVPLLTHTQRCRCRITIGNQHVPVGLPALLAAIDGVVVRCQNTLPRGLELLAVYRAHREPQFLEDALRGLLHSVYQLVGANSPEATIDIRASSVESIHDFDLSGEVGGSIADLAGAFGAV